MPLTAKNRLTMLRGAPPEAWCSVILDGSHVERRWLTVLQHQTGAGLTLRFGLLDDGAWSALHADGHRVFAPGNLVPFLPLLESLWTDLSRNILAAVRALGMPEALSWTFPLDDIVVLGLESSEHWRAKAEGWISAGYPLNDQMAALLPRHRRSRARERQRMAEIFGAHETPLRTELDRSVVDPRHKRGGAPCDPREQQHHSVTLERVLPDIQVSRPWRGPGKGVALKLRHLSTGVEVERFIGYDGDEQHLSDLLDELLARLNGRPA